MQIDFTETLFPPRRKLAKFVMPSDRFPLREKIFISFSGGETSAYMLKMILRAKKLGILTQEMVVLFANTGLEHEKTLRFVKRCSKEFGVEVIWLEAKVNDGAGNGTTFTVVDFDSASRNGEPFEAVIKKYGIPNKAYNHCTRETKLQPMKAYLRHIGWAAGTYSVAIGIRADEIDRISLDTLNNGGFYPCADAGVFKRDIKAWWSTRNFRLGLEEHYGNCVSCWKKSDRKLFTIGKQQPWRFDFFKRMEREHGLTGSFKDENSNPRTFFRNNRSALDILAACQRPFEPFVDGKFIPFDDEMDLGGGCGDSCEIGADLN